MSLMGITPDNKVAAMVARIVLPNANLSGCIDHACIDAEIA
jgi:hypothetical protein